MKLFNLNAKAKVPPYNEKARIKVLGACCKKATQSYDNVLKVAQKYHIANEMTLVSDDLIVANYGVLQTPAIVIDEKVVSFGNLITESAAEELIKQYFGGLK